MLVRWCLRRSEVGGQERTVKEGTSDSTSTVENRLTSQCKGERWFIVLVTGLPDKGNFQSGVSDLYVDVKVKTKLEKVTRLTLSEVKRTVSSSIVEVGCDTTIYLGTITGVWVTTGSGATNGVGVTKVNKVSNTGRHKQTTEQTLSLVKLAPWGDWLTGSQ